MLCLFLASVPNCPQVSNCGHGKHGDRRVSFTTRHLSNHDHELNAVQSVTERERVPVELAALSPNDLGDRSRATLTVACVSEQTAGVRSNVSRRCVFIGAAPSTWYSLRASHIATYALLVDAAATSASRRTSAHCLVFVVRFPHSPATADVYAPNVHLLSFPVPHLLFISCVVVSPCCRR